MTVRTQSSNRADTACEDIIREIYETEMPRLTARKRLRGFSRAEIEEVRLELLEEAVEYAAELVYDPLYDGDRSQVDFTDAFKEICGIMAYYVCCRHDKDEAADIVDRGGDFAQGCVMVGWSSVSRR